MEAESPPVFCIEVVGRLDENWSEWFEGMQVRLARDEMGSPVTILSGPVADQAALQGLLNKVWNLNLSLIAVYRAGSRRELAPAAERGR